jgi:hypothetical protein
MIHRALGGLVPAAWWAGGAERRRVAVSGLRGAAGMSSGSRCGPLGGGLLLLEVFAENLAHLAAGGPVVFGGSRADLLKQAYR